MTIILVATLSGCTLMHHSLVRLPSEQERSISDIASTRTDGNPREPIQEINALVTTPGGLNPPGKTLMITIPVEQTLSIGGLVGHVDEKHRAESECIRVIENFRKAGLPSEFSALCVSSKPPENYRSSSLRTYGETTFCAFVIAREDLLKGSPPRQTFKNFKYMKPASQ